MKDTDPGLIPHDTVSVRRGACVFAGILVAFFTELDASDAVGESAAVRRIPEATTGRFAGLAVFNRALTDSEMRALHKAANLAALPRWHVTAADTVES